MAKQHVFLSNPPRGNTDPENLWFFERKDLLAGSSCHLEQQDWSINKPRKPRWTLQCIEVYMNRKKEPCRNLWRSYGKVENTSFKQVNLQTEWALASIATENIPKATSKNGIDLALNKDYGKCDLHFMWISSGILMGHISHIYIYHIYIYIHII